MAASSLISGRVLQGKTSCPDETVRTVVPSVLWVGMAGCFIGHGAFGIITKAAWVPYFGVAGISEPAAWRLMPWIGTMDVVIGILALVRPCRALLGWAVFWATWTALLRPLSGESAWETVERAGNYGVPLALLIVAGLKGGWFNRLPAHWENLTDTVRARLAWTLRIVTFALLTGHGALGLFVHKAGLTKHYAALGFDQPASVTPLVGGFEILLAALVLIFPRPALLIGVVAWKLATESLFFLSGTPAPIFELIERFGSYAAPLALAFLLMRRLTAPPPAAVLKAN